MTARMQRLSTTTWLLPITLLILSPRLLAEAVKKWRSPVREFRK